MKIPRKMSFFRELDDHGSKNAREAFAIALGLKKNIFWE